MLAEDGSEVELRENVDTGDLSLRSIIEGDRSYKDEDKLGAAGFTQQEIVDGEFVDTEEDIYDTDTEEEFDMPDDYNIEEEEF